MTDKIYFRRGFAVITDFSGCEPEATFYKTQDLAVRAAARIAADVVVDCRGLDDKGRKSVKALVKAKKYAEAMDAWDVACANAPDNEDWMYILPTKLYTRLGKP